MSFCKVCLCGRKIIFAARDRYPEECPGCHRRIREFQTYREDDPQVAILLGQCADAISPEQPAASAAETDPDDGGRRLSYVLAAVDGNYEIDIPPDGGILGRKGIGAAQLAHNEAISREHLRITPRRNAGIIIQDMSTFGTKLNGRTVMAGIPTRVALNDRVTLYNEELILLQKR